MHQWKYLQLQITFFLNKKRKEKVHLQLIKKIPSSSSSSSYFFFVFGCLSLLFIHLFKSFDRRSIHSWPQKKRHSSDWGCFRGKLGKSQMNSTHPQKFKVCCMQVIIRTAFLFSSQNSNILKYSKKSKTTLYIYWVIKCIF